MIDELLFGRRHQSERRHVNRRSSGRQRIKFATSSVPYEIVQYLESLGVKVWPTSDISEVNGTMEAVIMVNASQLDYAAGLIAGHDGFVLLDPHDAKPIRPKTRWGVQGKRAHGILTATLRGAARFYGTSANLLPVKGYKK